MSFCIKEAHREKKRGKMIRVQDENMRIYVDLFWEKFTLSMLANFGTAHAPYAYRAKKSLKYYIKWEFFQNYSQSPFVILIWKMSKHIYCSRAILQNLHFLICHQNWFLGLYFYCFSTEVNLVRKKHFFPVLHKAVIKKNCYLMVKTLFHYLRVPSLSWETHLHWKSNKKSLQLKYLFNVLYYSLIGFKKKKNKNALNINKQFLFTHFFIKASQGDRKHISIIFFSPGFSLCVV